MKKFSLRTIFCQRYYDSLEDANKAVFDGEAWASVHIGKNFSKALIDRAIFGVDATNETLTDSRVAVRMDMTSKQEIRTPICVIYPANSTRPRSSLFVLKVEVVVVQMKL
jgi:hypothetical protein